MTGVELRMVWGQERHRAAAMARSIAPGRRWSARGMRVLSIASPVLKCALPDGPPLDPRFQQDTFAARHGFDDQPALGPARLRDRRAVGRAHHPRLLVLADC